MGRTGRRANALRWLLVGAGVPLTKAALPRPSLVELRRAGLEHHVLSVYRELGGVQPQPRVAPGAWDLEADGVGLELDEDLHFNRYRRITLDSPVYDRLGFDRAFYQRLCDEHASDCLSAGSWSQRWTRETCEREFGPPAAPGDLSGGGAPRWKQRAFYDFIKDTVPIVFGFPVARVPVWEPFSSDSDTHAMGVVLELVADGVLDPAEWTAPMLTRFRERTFIATAVG